MSEQPKNQPLPKFERADEFFEEYANNARFESSVFDLKVIFGQSEQRPDGEVIVQHTAITMPWAVAKLAIFYLQVNVALQELQNGKIVIPPSQVPPEPPAEFNAAGLEEAKRIVENIREQFLKSI